MLLLIIFIAGVVNFAAQKAVMESGHPFVDSVRLHFGAVAGERLGMFLDFVILAGTLLVVVRGGAMMPLLYLGYTAFNMGAAYLILNRKI